MFSGRFDLGGHGGPAVEPADLSTLTGEEGISFHQVSLGLFAGGYYLHRRLPYDGADCFYGSASDDIVVLFDGAIYNRKEMEALTGINSSDPDPVFMAEMFLLHGTSLIRDLNGDFAVFIGRPSQQEAYLIRDHAGVRPLAYSVQDGRLVFSTDITGLCRALYQDDITDTDFLSGQLRYIDRRKTAATGVKKLLPGHILKFNAAGITLERYWHPSLFHEDKTLVYEKMIGDLTRLVDEAVTMRCDGRFVAGAHASGGLDSGVVSVAARRAYAHQELFYGFSWSPAEYDDSKVRYDERELVRSYCSQTGITPVFAELTPQKLIDVLESSYYNQGFFYEDHLCDQAVARDVNLIFSGWGGDEFISTGDRGVDMDLLRQLRLRLFFRRFPLNRPLLSARWFLRYVLFPFCGILERPVAEGFRNDAWYLKKGYRKSDRRAVALYYFHRSRRQAHLRLFDFYHLQERCEIMAVNGYRRGIEYRYPLLDRRIIEYMMRIPSVLLCHDHDYVYRPLLRDISRGVLPDVVRLGKYKSDPVCWSFVRKLHGETATLLMKEMSKWGRVEDLSFIDFEKMEEDAGRLERDISAAATAVVNSDRLFRTVIYAKALYSFCLKYHHSEEE